MIENKPTHLSLNVERFIELESRVWNALVAGDPEADAAMLTDDFVGIYGTGVSGKTEHRQQLENGPIVEHYEILEPRIKVISGRSVMLSYLAEWTRPGNPKLERMYVSSLWQESDGEWKNSFSQDTIVAD